MGRLQDLSGQKFHRWTVISRAGNDNFNKPMWLCRCDCGTLRTVSGASLKSGNSQSCGCYKSEATSARQTTHGKSRARLYQIWCGMKKRCNNPKCAVYQHYGARGIKVSPIWEKDFQSFYDWAINNGYLDTLSIDRIDVNGDYCPENCRWATDIEQQNNTRANHYLTYNGETHSMKEWSKIKNIPYSTLRSRINTQKWDLGRALNEPVSCAGEGQEQDLDGG